MTPGSRLRSRSMAFATTMTLTAGVLAGAFSPGGRPEAAEEVVRVAFWSPVPQAQFAPFYAAQDLGHFGKYGLRFEFVGATGTGGATHQVIGGGADVGIGDFQSVMFAIDKGADVVTFYNYIPQNVFTITAFRSKGIEKIGDLKGKKLGVTSLAAASFYNCRYALERHGVALNQVEFIVVGVDYLTVMGQGRVDGVCSWDTHDYQLYTYLPKDKSGDLVTFPVRQDLNVPPDVFVAKSSFLNKKVDQLANFVRGYEAGLRWCRDNPEQAVKLMEKHVPTKGLPGFLLADIKIRMATSEESWMASRGLGTFEREPIMKLVDTYVRWGLVKRAPRYQDLLTNAVLERLGRR